MLIGAGFISSAEENYDFRHDTISYCRKIAELNETLSLADPDPSKGATNSLVLFKTSNTSLDFSQAQFKVQCVLYGPNGFSALLCDKPQLAVEWLRLQSGVAYAEIDSTVEGCSTDKEQPEISFHWGRGQKVGLYPTNPRLRRY